ncbi:hypothetical protein F5B22DRAFT_627409 [Xylaria bambusicola]|uniref:uncharacterized protein n=1 Tax=Xylaria bambusicola TaxID=326684 RepID=UPI0020072EAE|nr:uncharacterized protein F5B22DRAFT_627409 [Xylaria bambusicola]KAI0505551.1 hypothetical protein F5B22DRAFT_627409 [Xylaria bambusicola]
MATPPKRSPTPERIATEDPDTAAARKELRQTAISERPDLSAMATPNASSDAVTSDEVPGAAEASGEAATPERVARDDAAKEQMASPKKKRAHDEVDEPKDAAAGANADRDVSPIGSNGSASLDRTDRSEPEKKRPRDISSEYNKSDSTTNTTSPKGATASATDKINESTADKSIPDRLTDTRGSEKKGNSTTASAFKRSGMSSFASQKSPFLSASTGQTLSSFAGPSATTTFGLPSSTKSIFESGNSSSSGGASPFGQIGSSPAFGGFSGSLGGSRLTTFGKPGESLKSGKPAKPFGAPASEDENEGDEEDDGNTSDNDKDDGENQPAEEDKAAETEDKKKPKLQRIAVDDGEAGETTIMSVRARLYNLDKTSSSWKERGAGNLKINVPLACVRTDSAGVPIAGTFDASALEDAESKVVRLVMRQDSTHRVILNTAIIPAMKFQEKSSLKATYVLFTAIEGEGAVSIQIKMNAANAKSFLSEVESVQLQLQSIQSAASGTAFTHVSNPFPDVCVSDASNGGRVERESS